MIRRACYTSFAALAGFAGSARAQQPALHATVVYAVGREPTAWIPLFTSNREENDDVADQLFLHLAVFAPNAKGTADAAMVPALAKGWHRIDPLTLVFDIDPRAHWQDGAPVNAHDVVFTWALATNPKVGSDARLEPIASVEAVGDMSVRVRFKRPSVEQVYTFGFLVQPLPAHLLERLAPEAIGTSDFAQHPIGDGPFRFERRVAGQSIELRADTAFFLGRPSISRLLIRTIVDPTARVNAFVTGETDVLDKIPVQSLPQVQQHAGGRVTDPGSNVLVYALFNTRSTADSGKPHPILGDVRVREALTLALDRPTIALTTFGPSAQVPDAAQSQLWGWITGGTVSAASANIARAQTLLGQAGWHDANRNGILVKNGVPLRFSVLYGSSSEPNNTVALRAQQMWRAIGADAQLDRLEGPVVGKRVGVGQFDLVINRVGQDPTPSSLVQNWSCTSAHQPGSNNFAHWCDTTFDRLVATATAAKDQPKAWRAALAEMTAQHPAIFIAAPGNPIAIQQRYDNVVLWPSHTWLSLWQWRVRPGATLPRDQ
jgi:peptide/nickel transport system substrate-binding protein